MSFRHVEWGVDRLDANLVLPRHRHREGYANVCIDGSFVEANFTGRYRVRPGDVLLHGAFDCHGNCDTGPLGPRIIRLPWSDEGVEGRFRVADPDALARSAERDPFEAAALLEESLEPGAPGQDDWPAQLAADLAADPALKISDWAAAHGLAAETASRGFHRTFGVTPARFRLEARTREAWRSIVGGDEPLTGVAYDHGFADLAHMTRSVSALTGRPPSAWRAARRAAA